MAKKDTIIVQGIKVQYERKDEYDFISLTDIAKYKKHRLSGRYYPKLDAKPQYC